MQRYFLTEAYDSLHGTEISLEGDDYHHIVRVMRLTEGDKIYVAFTDDVAIVAEISDILPEVVKVKEISKELQTKELPVSVTIACGYPKGDKLDWIVQKGTELGARGFIGFPSQTSVVKWDEKKRDKKQARLEKIAKEAAEQSHRQSQPLVRLLESEKELLSLFSGFDVVLVAYEESAKQGEISRLVTSLSMLEHKQSVLAIFGPEGGFSPEEIDEFIEVGAKVCGLGPRILRAETAPLYLLSAISYQLELLN